MQKDIKNCPPCVEKLYTDLSNMTCNGLNEEDKKRCQLVIKKHLEKDKIGPELLVKDLENEFGKGFIKQ